MYLSAISLSLLLGGFVPFTARPKLVDRDLRELLDEPALAFVPHAIRVEIYRLGTAKTDSGDAIVGHRIQATGPPPAQELADQLSSVLLDKKSYDFATRRRCTERGPLLGISWQRKDYELARVVLGFTCNTIEMQVLDMNRFTVFTARAHFDPARAVLVTLARRGLPNDKGIQALAHRR